MTEIKVGLATCGISAGGMAVYNELKNGIKSNNLDIDLRETGCMGMCYEEVLVQINENGNSYLYSKVTAERAKVILQKHIMDKKPIEEWLIMQDNKFKDFSFLKKQHRIVLKNCGNIDPDSIEEYINMDGYKAIQKCLKEYTSEEVIDIIIGSGLKGRGGGGFPTGLKLLWI